DPELVMGVMPDVSYPTHTVSLAGSRSLLMYTDGAVEVKNPNGDHLDEEPFAQQLGEALEGQPVSAKQTVDTAVGIVRNFAGSVPFVDDITLLAIHLVPSDTKGDGGADTETQSRESRQADQPAAASI
ncbi:MAG: SpoIIE family protein phosphatase, partial [Planctomycetota bacterium]